MSKQHILIVEDDKDISRLIQYNTERAGFVCQAVFSGEEALAGLKRRVPDLIVLDVMLPGLNGLDVCRAIRRDYSRHHIPVIMLTAKAEEVDRIVGFELGADDYVVKPFSPRELVLRIKAVLRRKSGGLIDKEMLTAGDIMLDCGAHHVTVKGRGVVLTPMEFKLLQTLMERRGRVQSREKLLDDVWGLSAEVFTRTVDTHVKRLRQKLGPSGGLIETVVGVGYRFRQLDDEN